MNVQILVLCRGNVVRSPFIAGYLDYLYRTSGLADRMSLDIVSSGIEGKPNYPVPPPILAKGRELGFDLVSHRSKHANLKLLNHADIIIVTHMHQYARFKEHLPQLLHKVYHIYDFGSENAREKEPDIEDPSQKNTRPAYETFYQLVIPEVNRVWEYLRSTFLDAELRGIPFTPALLAAPPPIDYTHQRNYNFFTKRAFPLCPYCQSRRLKRIKRKGFLEKGVLPLLNGYPYHCGRCKRNFILFIGSHIPSRRDEKRQKAWDEFIMRKSREHEKVLSREEEKESN